MFTKAYVLSEMEFRSWLVDIEDIFVGGYNVDDYSMEDIREEFRDFLMAEFESLLDEGGVDELVVFVGGDVYEVDTGDKFIDLVDREYGIDKKLRGMGYRDKREVMGEGFRKRIKYKDGRSFEEVGRKVIPKDIKRRVNMELDRLLRGFIEKIPDREIYQILGRYDIELAEVGGDVVKEFWITGDKGRDVFDVLYRGERVDNVFELSWYRDVDGRWDITAYIS